MVLFFDVDGTIWDYKNYIPESTIEGIRKARKNGHKCFINSGRARAHIKHKDLLGIGFDGIVSACGCMIEYGDEVIFNKLLTRDECIRTVETIGRYGFKPILEGPKYLYMEYEDFKDDMYGMKVMTEMGDRRLGIRDNWGKWEINKLSCDTNGSDKESCFKELEDLYDVMLHTENICAMVPKGFNKGTGIEKVCELLGEDIKNTIAFGDSINDKEMLITANVGIAMGRASEDAKKYADDVTDYLENDGIYKALEKYNII